MAGINVRLVAGLLSLAVIAFGFLVWNFNRPPCDLGKLQQLERGMTQKQVRQILGEPRSTDGMGWHYSRPMAWPIVHIRFDTSGRLESHDYDY